MGHKGTTHSERTLYRTLFCEYIAILLVFRIVCLRIAARIKNEEGYEIHCIL